MTFGNAIDGVCIGSSRCGNVGSYKCGNGSRFKTGCDGGVGSVGNSCGGCIVCGKDMSFKTSVHPLTIPSSPEENLGLRSVLHLLLPWLGARACIKVVLPGEWMGITVCVHVHRRV